jgi:hypothetical protein
MLLWGKNAEEYYNDSAELANEEEFMREWRRDGPLGILLSVITFIKTPQQYALFEIFQRLAHCELPVEQRKVLCFSRSLHLFGGGGSWSLCSRDFCGSSG